MFARFRLSVCEQDYSKTPAWIWMKCCVSTDVGTWTNWLTFESDPDYSPDAGTGLLSPISYALQREILLRRENLTYRSLQRRVVLKWFYLPRAVGTTLSEVHALHWVPFWFINAPLATVTYSMTARWPNICKFLNFKMTDCRHFKNRFWPLLWAADCPVSVKFCTGKQNIK